MVYAEMLASTGEELIRQLRYSIVSLDAIEKLELRIQNYRDNVTIHKPE